MTKDGLKVSDKYTPNATVLELADTMRRLFDTIINTDLESECTIDDILFEYYRYGNKVNAIKISSITLACTFLAGAVVLTVLYFKKPKLISLD